MTINFEGGSMTAGAIAGMFEHKWPTTTRHLHVLETAGLLLEKRNGRNRVSSDEPLEAGTAARLAGMVFEELK